MFTLAIFCLTVSNLPSSVTFQVPMQYCSSQHRTWLSPPDTSATMSALLWLSCFILSFLCPLPVAHWTSSELGGSSSGVHVFLPFHVFMRFSQQRYSSGLHSRSQQTTFRPNSSLGPVSLGWSCLAELIASLSYTSPFAMTRLWSMKRGETRNVCKTESLSCASQTNTTRGINCTYKKMKKNAPYFYL